KGARVLVVKGVTRNFESLQAISSILEQAKCELVGALIVASVGVDLAENLLKYGVRKVKIIVRKTPSGFELSL
ncbi:MAG: hypothetical protein QW324_02645, partial [Thermofilaceae archaeon]